MNNNFLQIDSFGTVDMSKCSPELLFLLRQKPCNVTWARYIDSILNIEEYPNLSSQLNCAIIKK